VVVTRMVEKDDSYSRRGGTRNYFYVEMSGTTCRIEEIVVVGGQYVFYVFYVE
jgi:hypothetical protein